MPITVKELEKLGKIVRTKEEAIVIISNKTYTIGKYDMVLFDSPTDKVFDFKDLAKWFGRGIFVFTKMCDGKYILQDEYECVDSIYVHHQDDTTGRLVGLRLGSDGDLPNIRYKLEDKVFKEDNDFVVKKIDSSLERPDKRQIIKWREESGGESYKVDMFNGDMMCFGLDNYYAIEKHREFAHIILPNFSKEISIFKSNIKHKIKAIVAPFRETSAIPAKISEKITNTIDVDFGEGIRINNLELTTTAGEEFIIGRDLLDIFDTGVQNNLKELTIETEKTSLLYGYMLDSQEHKTLSQLAEFKSSINNSFYRLIAEVFNFPLEQPVEVYKKYKELYLDKNIKPNFTEEFLKFMKTNTKLRSESYGIEKREEGVFTTFSR